MYIYIYTYIEIICNISYVYMYALISETAPLDFAVVARNIALGKQHVFKNELSDAVALHSQT